MPQITVGTERAQLVAPRTGLRHRTPDHVRGREITAKRSQLLLHHLGKASAALGEVKGVIIFHALRTTLPSVKPVGVLERDLHEVVCQQAREKPCETRAELWRLGV